MATEDAVAAAELKEALGEVGIWVQSEPARPAPPKGLSHWERLTEDLEAHRAARKQLREVAVHFADSEPVLAATLERVGAVEDTHLRHLRDLIARADPQAID
jgi:hypothetical protein